MGAWVTNKTKNSNGSRLQLPLNFFPFTRGPTCFLKTLTVLIFVLIIAAHARPQAAGFLTVDPIIRTVQNRFKLNKKELAGILPLIRQENIEVLSIYTRFGGGESEYSAALWQVVIARRIDFENRISNRLNIRQKAALRAARTELEDRVLSSVVDDFVITLGQFLELDSLQADAVENILYSEYKQKHRLIVKQITCLSFCQKELETISIETERRMKLILSPYQFRDYKSFTAPVDTLIGAV